MLIISKWIVCVFIHFALLLFMHQTGAVSAEDYLRNMEMTGYLFPFVVFSAFITGGLFAMPSLIVKLVKLFKREG